MTSYIVLFAKLGELLHNTSDFVILRAQPEISLKIQNLKEIF
ncbi:MULTISPECIES: hypothetical protein [Helicobacter]|nr:hypothetical protein [Helicobacter sp. UBA3407]